MRIRGKTGLSTAPWMAALLAMILILSSSVPARATAAEGIVINPNGGTYVNVRAWPSYSADIISSVGVGAAVQITGSTDGWYSVWVNGVVGYMDANFIRFSDSPETPSANATVRGGLLNMREAPSMRARAITQLATGTRVAVLSHEATWTQIQVGQTIGYVMTSYLAFDGSGPSPSVPVDTPNANATIRTANGGNLNLRATASSSAEILGSYANGSRVRVLTQGTSWCRVQVGQNMYGYMSTRYLAIDGGSTGGNTGGGSYDAVVNNPGVNQRLNLRAEPSTDSTVLGSYANGTQIKVLGMGTQWLRVNVGGTVGYMMTQYVRVTNTSLSPHKTVTGGANGFVNLRSGPGYGYSVLRQISNGSAASVAIPYPTWSQVVVRQGAGYQTGYMLNSFLR